MHVGKEGSTSKEALSGIILFNLGNIFGEKGFRKKGHYASSESLSSLKIRGMEIGEGCFTEDLVERQC